MSHVRRGFTMVELMVVVIIIGILAAVAIPKYLVAVENSKADSGVAQLKMVGAANRMYAIDHGGNYVTGALVTNSAACSGATPYPATDLVGCHYLPTNDYPNMSYTIAAAGNGTNAGGNCPIGGGIGGASLVACVKRNGGSNPYSTWGYGMDINGVITCNPACGGNGNPPAPAQ